MPIETLDRVRQQFLAELERVREGVATFTGLVSSRTTATGTAMEMARQIDDEGTEPMALYDEYEQLQNDITHSQAMQS